MKLLSWNIQSGLGCDGIRSIRRIAEHIRQTSPEIICLQEVARFIPEYCSLGEEDQLGIFTEHFPLYTPIWGSGMRWFCDNQQPMEFGNLTLVRGVVLDSRVHPLPRSPGKGLQQMPRLAVETVIQSERGPVTIFNTHISYHNHEEQTRQLAHLTQLQQWQEQNLLEPVFKADGAYLDLHRTADTIICGDCNITPDTPQYDSMITAGWHDGWQLIYPDSENAPTCGCHECEIWPEGAHCRDYFWLSKSLASLATDMKVDRECDYSDHQPIVLNLNI